MIRQIDIRNKKMLILPYQQHFLQLARAVCLWFISQS